ncbi:diguanylate cyclase [Psychromonas arctica]|uniref:diguanylate cyclase n=1 Tax=Psychromonas arctica TaxID=168275 RepID=A0ABU9HC46_9GAMM
MFQSIKAKVITIFSLAMIIFTCLLLTIVFINERERVLDLELEKSTDISKMHANLLSQEFAQYVAMLQMVSDNPQLKTNDKPFIMQQLQRLMMIGKGNFINAIYVDKNFNLTDVLGHENKVTNPLFVHGEQWRGKEYNITVLMQSKFEKTPVIMVAVPILNNQQEWIGSIAVAVPISALTKKLSPIKLTKQSYAWLVDSNNLIVSHPSAKLVLKSTLSTEESKSYPGFYKIVKQINLQDHGYGRYMDAAINESKIVTFSKVDYLPGWTLFVTTKESEIFIAIYQILYNILIISSILMAIFLIFISQLSNSVTRPIIKLTKEIKVAVSSKNHDFEGVNSKDEIGQLSKAFKGSFKKIRSHTEHLEKVVNERTEEISTKNALLSEQNDKLEELVSKDPLTHLYNRRAFMSLLDKELARAKRHGATITLAILDIDHFKKVNDTFGHNVGDQVLCRFANELVNNMRTEDLICRWGGEEFVILLWEATADGAFNRMDQIREKISKIQLDTVGQITFSTGMVTMKEGEEFKDWLHRADDALYKAKATGRNRIVKN